MRDTGRWSVPATARDEISTLAIDSSSLTNASATATWVSVYARSPEQVTSSRPMLDSVRRCLDLELSPADCSICRHHPGPPEVVVFLRPACTRESPCAPAVILDLVLNSLRSYLHLRIWPYVHGSPVAPCARLRVRGLRSPQIKQICSSRRMLASPACADPAKKSTEGNRIIQVW
jgi:hypothetical protein